MTADPGYRTNQKPPENHCIECGKDPGDQKRCIECRVIIRRANVARRGLVFTVLLALTGWAGISAFGTLVGYLIDYAGGGSVSHGAQVAGGACFILGGVVFSAVIINLFNRWAKETANK